MTEGVSRSAALSQKAALQLPFPSTTPPVKMRAHGAALLAGSVNRALQPRLTVQQLCWLTG